MHVRTSGAGLVRVRGTEWGGARERSGERACGDAPGHDLHRGREVRAESEGAVVGLREAGGEVRSDIVLAAIGGSRAREWTFAGAGVWPFRSVTIRKSPSTRAPFTTTFQIPRLQGMWLHVWSQDCRFRENARATVFNNKNSVQVRQGSKRGGRLRTNTVAE